MERTLKYSLTKLYLYDTLLGFTVRYRQGKNNEYMHKSEIVWHVFSYSAYERQNPWSQCIHNSAWPVAMSNKSPALGTVYVSAYCNAVGSSQAT